MLFTKIRRGCRQRVGKSSMCGWSVSLNPFA